MLREKTEYRRGQCQEASMGTCAQPNAEQRYDGRIGLQHPLYVPLAVNLFEPAIDLDRGCAGEPFDVVIGTFADSFIDLAGSVQLDAAVRRRKAVCTSVLRFAPSAVPQGETAGLRLASIISGRGPYAAGEYRGDGGNSCVKEGY